MLKGPDTESRQGIGTGILQPYLLSRYLYERTGTAQPQPTGKVSKCQVAYGALGGMHVAVAGFKSGTGDFETTEWTVDSIFM